MAGKCPVSFVEELLLREHDGGLGVGDEDEHVAVQAELVDPLVQVGLNVDTRAVDDDDLLAEKTTFLNRPVDTDLKKQEF